MFEGWVAAGVFPGKKGRVPYLKPTAANFIYKMNVQQAAEAPCCLFNGRQLPRLQYPQESAATAFAMAHSFLLTASAPNLRALGSRPSLSTQATVRIAIRTRRGLKNDPHPIRNRCHVWRCKPRQRQSYVIVLVTQLSGSAGIPF